MHCVYQAALGVLTFIIIDALVEDGGALRVVHSHHAVVVVLHSCWSLALGALGGAPSSSSLSWCCCWLGGCCWPLCGGGFVSRSALVMMIPLLCC